MIFDAFIHWLHLLASIAWVGAMIFTSMVLQPVLRKRLTPETRLPLYHEIGQKFKALQLHSLIILVLTGLYKIWPLLGDSSLWDSSFGLIVAAKLCFLAAVIVLSYLHTYAWGPKLTLMAKEAAGAHFRELAGKMAFWGRVNLALSLIIILCAAFLHFPPG